ncbi:PstS family phosphate ABC transporter substrate-binding protein [Methanohalophilus sp.]
MTKLHRLLIIILILLLALFAAGCLNESDNTQDEKTNETITEDVKVENINIEGSTTVFPLAQAAAEIYMENHPEKSINVISGGSTTGIKALIDGKVDIAMASRKMKNSEKKAAEANGIDPVEHVIAWDGLTVVVNPANSVDQLTYDQIKGIYDGSISNWADVGGEDEEIIIQNRDPSSGTYGYFKDELLGEDKFRPDLVSRDSNGAIVQAVTQKDSAIGYIGFAYLDDSVKAVDIDAGNGMVEPTSENILSGKYPLARPLHFYTDGQPTGLAADFIEFILSEEGTIIINDVGYFPV